MTGFIRGFFSKPTSNEAEASAPVERPKREKAVRPEKEGGAFFLDSNEAQTFGNLEYMKTSKKIRRTFPKTVDSPEEKEFIQELSAMDRIVNGKPETNAAPIVESSPAESKAAESTSRRTAGSDMDMFLKMAKDIKK